MTDHTDEPTLIGHSITTAQGDLDLATGDGHHFHLTITPHGTDIANMAMLCLTAMELRTLQELIKVTLKANIALTEERARRQLASRISRGITEAMGEPEDGNPFVVTSLADLLSGRPPKRRPSGGDEPQGGTYL
jgi:hypothetical protein